MQIELQGVEQIVNELRQLLMGDLFVLKRCDDASYRISAPSHIARFDLCLQRTTFTQMPLISATAGLESGAAHVGAPIRSCSSSCLPRRTKLRFRLSFSFFMPKLT